MATIRHLGFMSAEFLTQAEAEVARVIKSRAGVKVSLEDNESQLDKFFKIPLSDWYNLDAKYTGTYKKSFMERTYKKNDGRWNRTPMREIRRYIKPKYFGFYDSFNHTAGTETTASKHEEQKPFQKYSFWALHWWFIKRNFVELSYKLTLCGILFWFFILGGFNTCLNTFIGGFKNSLSTKVQVHEDVNISNKKAEENLRFSKELEAKNKKNNKQGLLKNEPLSSNETGKNTKKNTKVLPKEKPPEEATPEQEKIVFLTKTYIMTDQGRTLQVGDKLNGKKIKLIDYKKRGVEDEDNNFIGFTR